MHYDVFIMRRLKTKHFNLVHYESKIEIESGNLSHIGLFCTNNFGQE